MKWNIHGRKGNKWSIFLKLTYAAQYNQMDLTLILEFLLEWQVLCSKLNNYLLALILE